MKAEFTPDHFKSVVPDYPDCDSNLELRTEIAAAANRALPEVLRNAPRVFGQEHKAFGWEWLPERTDRDTHQARIVLIEEIRT